MEAHIKKTLPKKHACTKAQKPLRLPRCRVGINRYATNERGTDRKKQI